MANVPKIDVPYDPIHGFPPSEPQIKFHKCTATEAVFGGSRGGGKGLPLDTKIPTPDGWTTMGELKPGDMVFSDDGTPVEVLAVSEIMHDLPCYKLTFDDGTEIICDSNHLWKTFTASDFTKLVRRTDEFRARRRAIRPSRSKGKRPDVAEKNRLNPPPTKGPPTGDIRTTEEIAKTITTSGVRTEKNHAVMNTKTLQIPEADLPVDPYVLGAWLGDGSSWHGFITCADEDLFSHIADAGYKCIRYKTKNNKALVYGIRGLITQLKKLGVYRNKHIPMQYLRASKEQRLALLQGLMDTDGHARSHGGVEFTATNEVLAKNVRELILSLGWKASIREGKATLNGEYISPKYRIVFTPDEYVFRIKRKRESQILARSQVNRAKHRFIVSCEPVPSVPVKCIQVSGNGMYLCTESMIPTHNSKALVMEALAYGVEHSGAIVYIFRETYDDLEANIIAEWKRSVPREIYTYHETKHVATLFNGTCVFFRYVRSKADAEGYVGRSIDWIGIDELTKIEEAAVQILLSSLRSPKGFPPRFRATCNPGGISHQYVKNRYIIPTNRGKKEYVDPETGNTIAFIPSTVYDNPAIMTYDPAYVKRLENLPPKRRAAFLHGDWDVYEGQAFEEFDYDIHTIDKFEIPKHWYRWRSMDNGFSDPFACYWFAVDEYGFVYIYREFTRERNDAYKPTYSEQAKRIVELSEGENIGITYVGHDAFASSPMAPGKTIALYYEQAGLRPVVSSIPDRRLRKAVWHEYLRPFQHGDKTVAKVRIFRNCEKLIETLPMLPEDEKDPEKYAECDFDHWVDGAGYGLVSYHVSKSDKPPTPAAPPLPWPLRTEEPADRGTDSYISWR